jgi:hypothetical protein
MPSTEVQRTLVKSPPELWTELSDPESLSRHLGELGEIRVIRVEPETAVEWEAEHVRGRIQLKPSGWGTKVTLSATRELPQPTGEEPEAKEPEPELPQSSEQVEPEHVEPQQVEPEHVEPQQVEPEQVEPEPVEPEQVEPEPVEPEQVEPEQEPIASPRRGFFSRLFRRRRAKTLVPGPGPEHAAEPEPEAEPEPATEHALPAEPEPTPTPESESVAQRAEPEPVADDRTDVAAELAAVEQAMVEQDTALLTAVLDRLGAAHHRPFSRG